MSGTLRREGFSDFSQHYDGKIPDRCKAAPVNCKTRTRDNLAALEQNTHRAADPYDHFAFRKHAHLSVHDQDGNRVAVLSEIKPEFARDVEIARLGRIA